MRFLRIFLFLVGSAVVNAQESYKVNCRFLCMDGVTPPEGLINASEKGEEIPCEVPENRLSAVTVCFAKGKTLNFLSAKDRKPAASATLPADVKSVILVFVNGAKTPNALPWRVFVIEDSDKIFPDGGAFVANFHSGDIRFIIGENKIMLRPAGSHGFGLPKERDAFNMAPVVFQFQQEEEWITASESLLRFLPGMRYLIFAYVDPDSGRPQISTFQDVKPFTPPAAGPKDAPPKR